MAIADILAAAQGGRYFANAGKACGLTEADARQVISSCAPVIAQRLKDKATADPVAFESLIDLLEDTDGGTDLNDAEAMTGAEAASDGEAVLKDLYGSPTAAVSALGLTGTAEAKAAGLSATAVLAALSAANATRLAAQPQPAMAGGDGILSAILRALVEGLVKGAVRQITPTKRRRRYSYTGDRRKHSTRRRTSTPGIDDIFRDILGRL